MPHNDTSKNDALQGGVGNAISHIGVHDLTDPGTGTNFTGSEAIGGSPAYGRVAVTWQTAGTPAAGQRGNNGALTFDVPAGTYGFFLLMNASTGNTGNYRGYIPFGGAAAIRGFGTSNAADVTADTVSSAAHGLANTDRVMLFNVFAESLPAGLSEGTIYFVVGAATDTFQVSLTSGGAAVNITGVGELMFQKIVPEIFGGQGQITVATNALVLAADGV